MVEIRGKCSWSFAFSFNFSSFRTDHKLSCGIRNLMQYNNKMTALSGRWYAIRCYRSVKVRNVRTLNYQPIFIKPERCVCGQAVFVRSFVRSFGLLKCLQFREKRHHSDINGGQDARTLPVCLRLIGMQPQINMRRWCHNFSRRHTIGRLSGGSSSVNPSNRLFSRGRHEPQRDSSMTST